MGSYEADNQQELLQNTLQIKMDTPDYKKIEEAHYDARVKQKNSFSSRDTVIRQSHIHYEKCISDFISANNKENLLVLDYGCGSGEKHFKFISNKVRIIGIDISSNSVEIARRRQQKDNLNAEYVVMDCEKMSFKDNTFDLILDYGTFSSLRLEYALPEIKRILKKSGSIISIETLGHNPITNFARFFNVLKGRRTKWASDHILKITDWQKITKEFNYSYIEHFGLTVLLLSPVVRILPASFLRAFEIIDHELFKIKFLRKYSFKTVAFLKAPIKD